MNGIINQGEWIAVKRIKNISKLIYGKIYYIVTKGEFQKLIRYVNKADDANQLLLIPYDNSLYPNQLIDKSDILEIHEILYTVNLF